MMVTHEAPPPRGDVEFGTIAALPRIAAARWGDRVAIEDGDVRITFSALEHLAVRAAASLIAAGIAEGDRVGIWAPNGWRWIVAALGVHIAGAAVIPLNTRYKAREAADILTRGKARALFTVNGFLGCDYVAALDALGDDCPALALRVVMHGTAPDGSEVWDAFLDRGAEVALHEVEARRARVRPDSTADVLFTSGTTGAPKGAVCAHAQNLRAFRDWADTVGLRSDDRYMIVAPFFHAFGYKAGWLAALMMGATIVPVAVFDADAVLRRVGPERITVLPGPPALYQSLLLHPDLRAHDLSTLRLAVTGAAVIPVELVERMRTELGFETVITGYGLTESSGVATMCRHGDPVETIAKTSGRALPGVELCTVNDRGERCAPGDAGEVWIRGYNVMREYFENPEATREAVDADGWLHTGDVGILDDRGYIRITDRIKDMFIVGGFNAYPAEIENIVLTHPDVAQAAVIGIPDPRLGEVGMLFVVPRPGHAIETPALTAWCREQMANFKVPRQIAVVDDLPRNASGKVQKFILRERASALPAGEG